MLIGFKVKNFRSFNKLQYFSMIAGKLRNKENHIEQINNKKVLKFSEVFGANGSGKTNLILAMQIVQIILSSGVNAVINNQYYRGNKANKSNDSYFEYEIAINGRFYSYGFELNFFKQEIVSEWLIDMTKPKQKIIFERDLKKFDYNTDLKRNNATFKNCLGEMKQSKKELFLSEIIRRTTMANNKDDFFNDMFDVYKFLMFDMIVIRPETHRLMIFDYLKNKEKILEILKDLDINIIDILFEQSDISVIEQKIPANLCSKLKSDIDALYIRKPKVKLALRIENVIYTVKKDNEGYKVEILKFKHKNSDSSFGTYEESDGTIRILEVIDILLASNKLFLIDEIESSLHPKLVDCLLKLFLDSKNKNQLIITTHNVNEMSFKLVRRDEIWFAEKGDEGDTKLFSLEEFKDTTRFDKKIDKAYMEGRFGGISNFKVTMEDGDEN